MDALKILDELESYIKDFGSSSGTLDVLDALRVEINTINDACCTTCRYFVENNQPTKDVYCNHCNIGTYDLDYDTEIRLDVDYDFCCNKYEEKGNK